MFNDCSQPTGVIAYLGYSCDIFMSCSGKVGRKAGMDNDALTCLQYGDVDEGNPDGKSAAARAVIRSSGIWQTWL